jgi:TPP-dependent pyruvate/acetoin dehydrogenase alpha subunit
MKTQILGWLFLFVTTTSCGKSYGETEIRCWRDKDGVMHFTNKLIEARPATEEEIKNIREGNFKAYGYAKRPRPEDIEHQKRCNAAVRSDQSEAKQQTTTGRSQRP